MVDLRDVQTGLVVGRIREEDLQFMIDQLEEERRYDRDYYLDGATIDHLAECGADAALVEALRRAMDGRSSIEVEWERPGGGRPADG